MTDFSKLVEDILRQAKPDQPRCRICGGPMHVTGWNSGKEIYACSSVKSINDPKDLRLFDPGHYANSVTEVPFGVDIGKLRILVASALGKIEAETEARVREELKAHKSSKKKEGEKELLLDEKKPG